MQSMQLFGFKSSPFVRHCYIVLQQSDIPFEFIETDGKQAAKVSPIAKVPYLKHESLALSDSASILKYIREKKGMPFLVDIKDYDLFTFCNAIIDSVVNIFLLELSGLKVAENAYLRRQQMRADNGLVELNHIISQEHKTINSSDILTNDALLRCAVFIEWGLFRKRIDIHELDHLAHLVAVAKQDALFADSTPSLVAT